MPFKPQMKKKSGGQNGRHSAPPPLLRDPLFTQKPTASFQNRTPQSAWVIHLVPFSPKAHRPRILASPTIWLESGRLPWTWQADGVCRAVVRGRRRWRLCCPASTPPTLGRSCSTTSPPPASPGGSGRERSRWCSRNPSSSKVRPFRAHHTTVQMLPCS